MSKFVLPSVRRMVAALMDEELREGKGSEGSMDDLYDEMNE